MLYDDNAVRRQVQKYLGTGPALFVEIPDFNPPSGSM